MENLRWTFCVLTIIAIICQLTLAMPANSIRVKRQQEVDASQSAELNPNENQESVQTGLEREKRKLPEAHFGSKNAILGFVFGKIDNFIDTKTRFIDTLDKTNVQKNIQNNIVVPKPITTLQGLITAVVSPKITGIGNLLSDTVTGVLGGVTALSGSSSGGAGGGGGANAGLGGFVSKFLQFSGPILQGSSGGGSTTEAIGTSDEAGY